MAHQLSRKTIELVRTFVKAETVHLTHQVNALNSTWPTNTISVHSMEGSVTIRSSARFGRKLNHTTGFGMLGPVVEDDLRGIEELYNSTGLQPEIDICESADPSAFSLLADSYSITGTIDTFKCALSNFDSNLLPPSRAEISISETSDDSAFVEASVKGFQDHGRSTELLEALARSAALRPDTTLFVAKIEDQIAGCAAVAFIETDGMKLANLYIDSTIPQFRGKGIHQALIQTRIAAAREAGCDFAIASARSESGSARNIEKAGFKQVLVTSTYTKKPV